MLTALTVYAKQPSMISINAIKTEAASYGKL